MRARLPLLAGIVILGALAGRLYPDLTLAAAGLAVAGLAWRLARSSHQGGEGTDEDQPASSPRQASEGSSSLLVALAVGLTGAWLATRRPWEPWAGTLLWAGGLWIALAPRPGTLGDAKGLALGAVSGILVAGLAQRGLPPEPGTLAIQALLLLVMVTVGRLAVVQVARSTTNLAGVLVALGVGLPLAAGRWGLIAVGVEALAAAFALALDEETTAWGWALGGIAGAAGVLLAPLLPGIV